MNIMNLSSYKVHHVGVGAMRRLFGKLGLTLLLVAGLSACASDVVDIDRTQANRVSKSILEGEWYFRPIVIEAQYNQGMLFEGLEGDMERI